MRKTINLLFIVASILFFGCEKNNTRTTFNGAGATEEIRSESSNGSQDGGAMSKPSCPDGTHPVVTYEFGDFRFHRPKLNCERGFWFCTTDGKWEVKCVPDNPVASIKGRNAFVWGRFTESKIELHFPIELRNTPGYTEDDLSLFSVDDAYEIMPGIILKPGNYKVFDSERDLIVLVDLF